LHLEVVLDRMKRDFGLQVTQGKPRVSYRETVGSAASGSYEYRRKIGDHDLFARIGLSVEPQEAVSAPVQVVDRLPEGAVPPQFMPAIVESAHNAAAGGGAFGYPVTGVTVTLREAVYDEAGQPEIALNSATSMAFREALREADSVVLEPYGRLEVRVPEDYLGGVVKSLNQRRALVEDTDYLKNAVLIRGVVPIAEMFGYLTILRSQSQGRGSFSLEPLDFRPVPGNLAESGHSRLF
jgi:elongation factor G